jgi:hypothetical protein
MWIYLPTRYSRQLVFPITFSGVFDQSDHLIGLLIAKVVDIAKVVSSLWLAFLVSDQSVISSQGPFFLLLEKWTYRRQISRPWQYLQR